MFRLHGVPLARCTHDASRHSISSSSHGPWSVPAGPAAPRAGRGSVLQPRTARAPTGKRCGSLTRVTCAFPQVQRPQVSHPAFPSDGPSDMGPASRCPNTQQHGRARQLTFVQVHLHLVLRVGAAGLKQVLFGSIFFFRVCALLTVCTPRAIENRDRNS